MASVPELQAEIAGHVFHAAPEGGQWDVTVLTVDALYMMQAVRGSSYRDGVAIEHIDVPTAAVLAAAELRELMADEHGAWFSVRVSVFVDGRYEFEFDYDSEPDWDGIPPTDDAYLEDLERFPRPVGEIPGWHPAAVAGVSGQAVSTVGVSGAVDPAVAVVDVAMLEYEVAAAVYAVAGYIAGWDRVETVAEGDGLGPPSGGVIRCWSGLEVVSSVSLSPEGVAAVAELWRGCVSMRRRWRSVTVWLESDGQYVASYEYR